MRLKEARQNMNFTQEMLAQKVGVTRQTISMIETGVNLPSIKLAKKLGKVLKVKWVSFFID